MPSKLIASLRGFYLLILLFNFFFVFSVFADDLELSSSRDSVYQNDMVFISGAGGTPDGIFTLWVTNSSGEMVWAVQDTFSSSGVFDYKLIIPLDWQPGNFTVFLRDYSTDYIVSNDIIVIEYFSLLPVVNFMLSDLRVSPSEVGPDEEVTVTVTVSNVGEIVSDYTVELLLDYETMDTRTVTLDVGHSTTVGFDVTSDLFGTHIIEIGELLGEFNVVEKKLSTNLWLIVDLSAILIAIGGILYLRKMKML